MLNSFECRVFAHLTRVFPLPCKDLGEEAVRKRVRAGIASAAGYGITSEYDVVRYVDLMFILAEDFDKAPNLSWAARILTAEQLHPKEKMDGLYERLSKELKAASPR